jgi:UDPglucose--hexose-1-phosphate uridylyltransferase
VLEDRDRGYPVTAPGEVRAWCPYASTTPYHLRLAHDASGARFDLAPDHEVRAVAVALRDTLAALLHTANDPPYNVVVHSAPAGVARFRWYIEIIPRLAVVAGFELATGLFVDTVDPEVAAAALRANVA